MVKLSPSSLNLYLECPRCFWLYINKKIKRPEKPVATITTGIDRIIKEHFELYRKKNIIPPILEGKVPGRLIADLPKNGWLEYINEEFDAKLGGFLDECLQLKDGVYAPLDHKTRGTRPEETHPAHKFQMDVYTFLLEVNGFPTEEMGYLVYYIPKSFGSKGMIEVEIMVSCIKTDPKFAKETFYQALQVLSKPIPSRNKNCDFCKWTETIDIK
ncbi:MAG: PD-(D/E)XK nuclease family protein [Candidatus Omnitrophica bacterium]|nr:PD-(D/E)XK nuclease family protein [Candidatus Omnitrophota bacterium]